MNFLKIADNEKEFDYQDKFEEIAKILFNKYAIKTHNDELFRLTEIEFYWYSDRHPDKSVYERKHYKPKIGEWFFHYSGVDIALDNDFGRGGILIRGIQQIEPSVDKITDGPLKCAMKLFSGISVNSGQNNFAQLVLRDFKKIEPVPSIRVRVKTKDNERYNEALYAFKRI